MSNSLLPISQADLPVGKYANDEDFSELAKSADWLPRVQLFTAGSNECKAGNFPPNHWGFVVGKKITNLTKEVDVVPISWRPKAMQIVGKDITSVYNRQDPEFKRIEETSTIKDSGCMVGPEYLVWVPSIRRFGSYFMASASAKTVAPDMMRAMKEERTVTLSSHFVDGKKYKWQAPLINNCSTPIQPEDLPSEQQLRAEVTKFANPLESAKELAQEAPPSGRAR